MSIFQLYNQEQVYRLSFFKIFPGSLLESWRQSIIIPIFTLALQSFFAGIPAWISYSGISLLTIDPAATTAPLFILTPRRTLTPVPSQTSSLMIIFFLSVLILL